MSLFVPLLEFNLYTREQLPQDWAMTQNNLASALKKQGIRTGGAHGTELLAQAVDAYRSALEVYTREVFPSYHEQVQQNLDRAEALLSRNWWWKSLSANELKIE